MRTELSDEAFIIEKMFMIPTKSRDDAPFILNNEQRHLDLNLTGRDLIPKARQLGVSSYFLARYTAKCLFKRNTRAVVISHEGEATQRMLLRVKYFLENMQEGIKPAVQNYSQNEITFPKTNSMFYIGTAGSRKFGRGDTITDLLCSEYAFWPNASVLMQGLLQAVPLQGGEIAIESTGNGLNDYYQRCLRAKKGESFYACHFLNWINFSEYQLPLSDSEAERFMRSLNPEWEEDKLAGLLSPQQLAWRRMKLEELNYDIGQLKAEYPITFDECFQHSGQSIFHKVLYQPTEEWEQIDRHLHILHGHPRHDYTYSIGADSAAGVEKDAAVAEIICVNTMEQVGEYVNNKIDPEAFASKLIMLGKMFNDAYIVPEQNNHGLVTISYLIKGYPRYLIWREPSEAQPSKIMPKLSQMGWKTTSPSKHLMIGLLRTRLANDIIIHSEILQTELSTFIEHEDGSLGAADGCHDDTVIGMACAVIGLPKANLHIRVIEDQNKAEKAQDPFLLDNIIKELEGRGRGFPISPQNDRGWKDAK